VDIQRFPSAFTGTAIRCNRPGCSMLMGHALYSAAASDGWKTSV
jgi:hypothetical protein